MAIPSTPSDVHALLKSAIASPNPTIFLEHKALYATRGELDDTPVPLGLARVTRPGRDVTLITSQLMTQRAIIAAERLGADGIEAEIVDLRTLYPLDMETIEASARRTRRVLVCHEAPRTYGFGAELAAELQERLWDELDAPVGRLGGARAPIPYAAELENAVIPSVTDIAEASGRVARGGGPRTTPTSASAAS